jgi:hypothetical protein
MVSIGFPGRGQATALLQGLGVAVAAAGGGAAGGRRRAVSIGRLDTARGNRARFVALWGGLFLVAALAFGTSAGSCRRRRAISLTPRSMPRRREAGSR